LHLSRVVALSGVVA